jgi:hypothetical protein
LGVLRTEIQNDDGLMVHGWGLPVRSLESADRSRSRPKS